MWGGGAGHSDGRDVAIGKLEVGSCGTQSGSTDSIMKSMTQLTATPTQHDKYDTTDDDISDPQRHTEHNKGSYEQRFPKLQGDGSMNASNTANIIDNELSCTNHGGGNIEDPIDDGLTAHDRRTTIDEDPGATTMGGFAPTPIEPVIFQRNTQIEEVPEGGGKKITGHTQNAEETGLKQHDKVHQTHVHDGTQGQ